MAGGVYDGLYNGYRSGGGSLVDYLLLGPRMALRAACTEGEAKEVSNHEVYGQIGSPLANPAARYTVQRVDTVGTLQCKIRYGVVRRKRNSGTGGWLYPGGLGVPPRMCLACL